MENWINTKLTPPKVGDHILFVTEDVELKEDIYKGYYDAEGDVFLFRQYPAEDQTYGTQFNPDEVIYWTPLPEVPIKEKLIQEAKELYQSGKELAGIKAYRTATGEKLSTSKIYCEENF